MAITKEEYIKLHFPDVDSGITPCGAQILVQLRSIKQMTQGGILLAKETKEFNNGNTQVARVVKLGQIAFRNRETGTLWTEGAWASVGDIIIAPRWGGFRVEVPIEGTEDTAIFAVFDDVSVKLVVDSNFESFDKLL